MTEILRSQKQSPFLIPIDLVHKLQHRLKLISGTLTGEFTLFMGRYPLKRRLTKRAEKEQDFYGFLFREQN